VSQNLADGRRGWFNRSVALAIPLMKNTNKKPLKLIPTVSQRSLLACNSKNSSSLIASKLLPCTLTRSPAHSRHPSRPLSLSLPSLPVLRISSFLVQQQPVLLIMFLSLHASCYLFIIFLVFFLTHQGMGRSLLLLYIYVRTFRQRGGLWNLDGEQQLRVVK